eukprot:m.129636 g.129636  ORF g.129636 m.129636 type:complete len:130 (-) comp16410_c0_seq6:658-1047(-)
MAGGGGGAGSGLTSVSLLAGGGGAGAGAGSGAGADGDSSNMSFFSSARRMPSQNRKRERPVPCVGELLVHSDAVTRLLHVGDDHILSCSSDKMVLLWSTQEAHAKQQADAANAVLRRAANNAWGLYDRA